ncbi:ribosomal protein L7/L12 [Flavobacterium sp. UBA7680]|uniref:ribosomal protein L7/L12 n=1 Tax=Flavobacterium sp. UBA7680 TaxID=1946559 RepID=UPI0025BE7FFD|nr:ribosomal protein L7/L12 [Flavobacterium sp. UBA7680]
MEFQRYFQSFTDYFWEWDNQIFSSDSVFETITIPNGQTIGYEKFVFEILEFLSENNFPPFGTLLLAITATNHDSQEAIDRIDSWAKSIEITKSFPVEHSFRLGASIGFLRQLSALPEEYKSGENRLKMFQTIFDGCHNRISSEKAKKILDEYKEHRHHLVRAGVKDPFNEANFIKDFRTLALLKTRFPTVQSILYAMENLPHENLNDKLKEEILEEKNPSDTASFVDQLIEDNRTFEVGSLIKRLWSGLNIPLHHNHPSEQPLGGVSDLTNKGDFDKLVISEFAYDDDIFMSRIANNEALYIQREVPPQSDKFERILLIDSSLKNWGNPKILSFASAIAIGRHPKTDIACRVFILDQDFKEVSLENIHDVINALGKLSGKLDCSDGLESFFLQNKISSKNQEVFLFSSEDSLKLTRMQNIISNYFTEIKYVFEMEMEGIRVYKNQNKGRKMLQHIIMPLDELWQKEKQNLPRRVSDTELNEFPILYPVERGYQNIFYYDKDFYIYLNGNLFLFVSNSFDKGFKKIASNLPFDKGELAIKTNAKGELFLLCYICDLVPEISLFNINTQELKSNSVSNEEVAGLKITPYGFDKEFYLTDGILYWHVDDDLKLVRKSRDLIKEAFLTYIGTRTAFVNGFMQSRFKYSTIKRLKGLSIVENSIEINGFNLAHLEFSKSYYSTMARQNAIRFDEKVNLILKNRGTSVLDLVKTIKLQTGKSLAESKTIVDGEFGVILNDVTRQVAETLKKMIEGNGAVCYIQTLSFESKDGSKVTNKDGILIFESSKEGIPTFYIPFIINGRTIMATESEYSGNDYFISDSVLESIKEKEFLEKYLEPFIQNVKQHGT